VTVVSASSGQTQPTDGRRRKVHDGSQAAGSGPRESAETSGGAAGPRRGTKAHGRNDRRRPATDGGEIGLVGGARPRSRPDIFVRERRARARRPRVGAAAGGEDAIERAPGSARSGRKHHCGRSRARARGRRVRVSPRCGPRGPRAGGAWGVRHGRGSLFGAARGSWRGVPRAGRLPRGNRDPTRPDGGASGRNARSGAGRDRSRSDARSEGTRERARAGADDRVLLADLASVRTERSDLLLAASAFGSATWEAARRTAGRQRPQRCGTAADEGKPSKGTNALVGNRPVSEADPRGFEHEAVRRNPANPMSGPGCNMPGARGRRKPSRWWKTTRTERDAVVGTTARQVP
jgi:hypothetical protein